MVIKPDATDWRFLKSRFDLEMIGVVQIVEQAENVILDMKHIVKILTLLVAISAFWIGLLQTSIIPCSYTWLLPLYLIVSLGCYGLLMVGVGLMQFPTCPHEAVLLQQDVVEAKEYLKQRGVDVGMD
ncbi:hypothetical protein RHMOL_Rhmol01G0339800 [Rhododendron molle]|uniref:Uncharacterized protein n=3 Tax=Rhododendron molle TaxID=49168 RepID=A0ACC0Q8R1_RHOML|nr:hypothetical protein RHMOL_Rhmol01G0339800 [Rhododendron molle]